MYIKSASIVNVKSLTRFDISFAKPEGWHVIIGDNGAGKSTSIKSIALALVSNEGFGLRINKQQWIQKNKRKAIVALDLTKGFANLKMNSADSTLTYESEGLGQVFSAGFGPFRRFTGGNYELAEFYNNPSFQNLARHLTLFGEDVALTEATKWIQHLQYQTLEKSIDSSFLERLISFINTEGFLPHGTKLDSVSSKGVFFRDGNNALISVGDLSDGYRSILSLTFELIRQLVGFYGESKVFSSLKSGANVIDVPGVVLIDEVDAHLHPTWQVSIGSWFLKYFPRIQFVVTTHSPLVCRASKNGSIWRLAAPGSKVKSGEVTGFDRERLINGDIMDAYGTELFGRSTVRIKDIDEQKKELGDLNILKSLGKISEKEDKRRDKLLKTFQSND